MFKDSEEPQILPEDTNASPVSLDLPELLPFPGIFPSEGVTDFARDNGSSVFPFFSFDINRRERTPAAQAAVEIDPTDRLMIEGFFRGLNQFNMTYEQRYCYRGSENAIVNVDSFREFWELINSVDNRILRLIQNDSSLTVCFQSALQELLRKIDMLEAQSCHLNNAGVSLEQAKSICLAHHYDDLQAFKSYVMTDHYLVKFRYFFPMANWDPEIFPNRTVPDILSVAQVKIFLERLKTLYGVAFKPEFVLDDRVMRLLPPDEDDIRWSEQQQSVSTLTVRPEAQNQRGTNIPELCTSTTTRSKRTRKDF